jgi:hypothetical protein
MAVDERRVVQVFAPAGGGKGMTGSGYLIADGLALTARHVVEAATGLCEVRALGRSGWVVAGEPLLGGADCDAALVRSTSPTRSPSVRSRRGLGGWSRARA